MKRDQASFGGADPKRPRIGPSSEEIARTIEEREAARKNRDYSRADQLRTDLKAQGVELCGKQGSFGRPRRRPDGRLARRPMTRKQSLARPARGPHGPC